MSAKDTNSLLRSLKKRRRHTETSKTTPDGELEETRLFLSWLEKCYDESSAGPFPVINEFLLECNGETVFLDTHEIRPSTDTRSLLKVYYDTKNLTVKKISCFMTCIGSSTLLAIQKTIFHCLSLNILQLDFCDLSPDHIKVLQTTVKSQKSISSLSLKGNTKCNESFHLLIDSGIKFLSLKLCKINQFGLKKIAGVFLNTSPDTGLLHLDLSSNPIYDEGCKDIATILRCDRTLVSLNVADCKITDYGLTQIIDSFQRFSMCQNEILLRRKLRFKYYGVTEKKSEDNCVVTKDSEDRVRKHPFTNAIEQDGELFCQGNNTLENLNLAYNSLTSTGLDDVIKLLLSGLGSGLGLKKVGLEGNLDATGEDVKKSVEELLNNKTRKSAGSVKSRGSLKKRKSSARNSASGAVSAKE